MKTTPLFDSIARASVSFHITGHIPSRELDAEDMENAKEWFETVCIVNFPRGFEPLQIAVYGANLSMSDCADAAHEWLSENHPEASAENDEEESLVSCVMEIA